MGLTILMFPFKKDFSDNREEVEKHILLSDFRMGPDEMVEGREAKVLHYRRGSKKDGITVTLWLDTKTLLPVKRVAAFEGTKARIIDLYREFVLDPKVDASAFDLPK